MEKPRPMTAFEIGKATEELSSLGGSVVKKVYTERGKRLVLRVFAQGGERDIVFMPGYVFAAQKVPQAISPEPFAMFLRKRIGGRRMERIFQIGRDRIMGLDFGSSVLVVELFRDFNVIYAEEGRIVSAMTYGEWKDRAIKRGLEYRPPPSRGWDEMLERKLEAYLTLQGFGKPYSREFIERFGNPVLCELDRSEVESLMEEMWKRPIEPYVSGSDYAVVRVSGFEGTRVPSISSIFSHLYVPASDLKSSEPERKRGIDFAISKLRDKLKDVESKISWVESHPEIYSEFDAMRGKGSDAVFGPLKFSLLRPLREQISELYEERKRLRRKLERAERIVSGQLSSKKGKKPATGREKKSKIPPSLRKFRVFDYGNFMFVLGKDASTNEELVKRHSKMSKVVAHAFVDGSPFGIAIGNPPQGFEKWLCDMVACYSKAWKAGLGIVESYWVLPEQVSKKAPAGEYLSKGSFMVYGKKNIVKSELRLCFCNRNGKLAVGPEDMVRGFCPSYVCITPGNMKARDAAKLIRNRIGKDMPVDEIERAIPYGSCNVELR